MTAVLKRIVTACYETTDGRMFGTKSEAQTHQRDLSRMADVEKLIKGGLLTNAAAVSDELVTDIAAFIVAYGDDLREVLPKRAVAAPATPVPSVPTSAIANPPGAPVAIQPVAEVPQQGQLPVNPVAAVVATSAADAELAELMAGLDAVAA